MNVKMNSLKSITSNLSDTNRKSFLAAVDDLLKKYGSIRICGIDPGISIGICIVELNEFQFNPIVMETWNYFDDVLPKNNLNDLLKEPCDLFIIESVFGNKGYIPCFIGGLLTGMLPRDRICFQIPQQKLVKPTQHFNCKGEHQKDALGLVMFFSVVFLPAWESLDFMKGRIKK